jgi:hypothetical protein
VKIRGAHFENGYIAGKNCPESLTVSVATITARSDASLDRQHATRYIPYLEEVKAVRDLLASFDIESLQDLKLIKTEARSGVCSYSPEGSTIENTVGARDDFDDVFGGCGRQ